MTGGCSGTCAGSLPTMCLAPVAELSRHRVFGMLRRKGLLTRERIKLPVERFNPAMRGFTAGSIATRRGRKFLWVEG
jgi:hypothetical protein